MVYYLAKNMTIRTAVPDIQLTSRLEKQMHVIKDRVGRHCELTC